MQFRCQVFHLAVTALMSVIELLQLYEREKMLPFIFSLNCTEDASVTFAEIGAVLPTQGQGALMQEMEASERGLYCISLCSLL